MGESVRRVRVGVVLFNQDNQILLCRQNNNLFWVLPGGTLEPNETLLDCAVRELKEEADLDIEVEGLLGVSEFFPKSKPAVVDFFALGELIEGELKMTEDENLNEMKWVSLQDASAIELKPDCVKPMIEAFRANNPPILMPYWKG